MPYSYLNDYTLTDVTPVVEVITVAEAKQYCRVDNTVENDLFEELITQSREAVEKASGLSITPKIATVWFTNLATMFNFPFGPIVQFSSLTDNNGNVLDPAAYKLIGGDYPSLKYPAYADMKAVYSTGMEVVPKELKIAILDQINYGYENRGMDVNDMGICEKTWRVCQRWTRTSPIL